MVGRGSQVDRCTCAAQAASVGNEDHEPTGWSEKYPAGAGGSLGGEELGDGDGLELGDDDGLGE
ncbi:MAG TPA: hypothetical protein VNN79_19430, partial [Actinomycetota bacterium]|nr:hypothetical protein [Actinomycetota bacterium]